MNNPKYAHLHQDEDQAKEYEEQQRTEHERAFEKFERYTSAEVNELTVEELKAYTVKAIAEVSHLETLPRDYDDNDSDLLFLMKRRDELLAELGRRIKL